MLRHTLLSALLEVFDSTKKMEDSAWVVTLPGGRTFIIIYEDIMGETVIKGHVIMGIWSSYITSPNQTCGCIYWGEN